MISCTIIPVANLGAKLLAIWWNKKSFFSLMKYLESPEFNAHNEVQNRYIQVVHQFAKVLLKILIAIVAGYVVVTGVSPFITDTAMMIPPPNDMGKYNLFYKIIHIFMQFYLGSTSICHDLLFMTLFGLCIAQLNILQHKLLNVYEEALELSVEVGLSSRFTEKQLLKDCVILHETIHQYVGRLSIVVSFPLSLQYFCGCFLICSIILQLTILDQTDTFSLLSIISIATIIFSQLACYHWLGNEIALKSSNIIEACYLSNWYNLNHESQMTLLLLMENAKQPLPVQLYKIIHISLESLGVIFRWSYSLFALIKARYS
ncbi:7tm Odorant receptor [Popillia japonica]|uniref:7tm Odorant receptor n=1 Tax=Popillia japonica TaxID=7064 RepID=A0AAW1L607_POPJA